ncbi:RecQ family ATP-dependent DNA helicase [Alkalihalobacillus sp. 1P02AB]|uniref:RecQ family ATP-dependent DNA helicase n=1 Tax=Alkalihalobacillus sp. 1P02AB TaxID=3132260 RepID=UPI0039A77025
MIIQNLCEVFGSNANFRVGQEHAINLVLQKNRVLVVQKTGWGKSLVYFLATRILRQRGEGVTLIISPLLSLTRNQMDSTHQYGVVADCINSQINKTVEDKKRVISRCNKGECDVLFITPEQLKNKNFVQLLSQLEVGLFVVDEAHCISDWGHDFRPDYQRIKQLLQILPGNIAVLATTATANERVITDISNQLGDCEVVRGNLQRESLYLHKLHLQTAEEKYAWILNNVNKLNGSGIIYATTINECKRVALWLQHNGINAEAYHAQLPHERQIELEKKLANNEVKVLVSTIALGMGYDKEDIGFVIHYYTPKSVIEYYQQVGRAGRAIKQAVCVLLYGGEEENRINQFFMRNSFPKEKHVLEVLNFLESHDVVKKSTFEKSINIKSNTLNQILTQLLLDGFIEKDSRSNYSRTVKKYQSQQQYYVEVIVMKEQEYQQMLEYQKTEECLMQFLIKALDSPGSEKCGNCSICRGDKWGLTIDTITEQNLNSASSFFSKNYIHITPRKRSELTYKLLTFTHEEGLALSSYHEYLGQKASEEKYKVGSFSNELVQASVFKLKPFLQERNVDLSDLVVIPIPSNRRRNLVPDFANKVADALKCTYENIFKKYENEPEQKSFLNSQLQEQAIRDYLYIESKVNLDNRQLLLVDDFVDSKWTFTVASELLGELYSNIRVIPFALADTSGSD